MSCLVCGCEQSTHNGPHEYEGFDSAVVSFLENIAEELRSIRELLSQLVEIMRDKS